MRVTTTLSEWRDAVKNGPKCECGCALVEFNEMERRWECPRCGEPMRLDRAAGEEESRG